MQQGLFTFQRKGEKVQDRKVTLSLKGHYSKSATETGTSVDTSVFLTKDRNSQANLRNRSMIYIYNLHIYTQA